MVDWALKINNLSITFEGVFPRVGYLIHIRSLHMKFIGSFRTRSSINMTGTGDGGRGVQLSGNDAEIN